MPIPSIKKGSLVWAEVNDPNTGAPAGEHACMVLNKQDEIDAGEDLRVAVVTSKFTRPIRSGWFQIPHRANVHPETGLYLPSVVKATWYQIVPQANVRKVSPGRAPTNVFRQVLNWLVIKGTEKPQ